MHKSWIDFLTISSIKLTGYICFLSKYSLRHFIEGYMPDLDKTKDL